MRDDAQLLRCYAEEKSDAAFAELVQRHLGLVYHAALRQLGGDAHLAQDVAQVVFTDLARKASALAQRPVLAGWLYTSTRYAATQVVRSERRRQAREQESHTMNELLSDNASNSAPSAVADWEKLRPVIDDAMHALAERDREAVLLRFFEGRAFAEVGAKLAVSEDAARMRVERALEKLRALLTRRGVTSTSGALALVLANQAAAAAPAGLAVHVSGAALAGAAVVGTAVAAAAGVSAAGAAATSGGGAAWGLTTFMSLSKLHIGVAGAIAVAGTTGFVAQENVNAALRAERAAISVSAAETAAQREENRKLAEAANEVSGLRREAAELPRLREESAALRARIASMSAATAKTRAGASGQRDATDRAADRVFKLSELDARPMQRFMVPPVYPLAMKAAGVTGVAVLDLVIGPEGDVRTAVVSSSDHEVFGAAALEAVKQWKFDPGQKNGKGVTTRVMVPIRFQMNKEEAAHANFWF